MFIKTKFSWNVVIPAEDLHKNSLLIQRAIIIRLLDTFATKKATEDLGYFITPTTVEQIGEGKIREQTGEILFPVVYNGISFKIFPGEILHGVVDKVHKLGVFLRSGPYELILLPQEKMSGYEYSAGETPVYEDQNMSRIQIGAKVRFIVVGTLWMDGEKDFRALASIDGDNLGPF